MLVRQSCLTDLLANVYCLINTILLITPCNWITLLLCFSGFLAPSVVIVTNAAQTPSKPPILEHKTVNVESHSSGRTFWITPTRFNSDSVPFSILQNAHSFEHSPSPAPDPTRNTNQSPHQIRQRSRRSTDPTASTGGFTPPRILPDLPNLIRFFDRTGLQIRCRSAGHPPPTIRWFSLPASAAGTTRSSSSSSSSKVVQPTSGSSLSATVAESADQSSDESHVGEMGYSHDERATFQADQATPVEITSTTTRSYISSSSTNMGDPERGWMPASTDMTNQKATSKILVGNGWLNFTATRSSTMRMVFFCQAENYLGRVRSRKMVVHQVPMPDENLRIIYTTFPIKPDQKAVVTCQPEQEVFNRFLKVNYWDVYLNGSHISRVDRSFGRFSMINVTKHSELHIRSVTDTELSGLEVRCVLQSIVDESVKVERPERGRLQRSLFGFSYTELRSVGTEVNVLRGSTVELPWALEGELRVGVSWFYVNDASRTRQAIALNASVSGSSDQSRTGGAAAPADRGLSPLRTRLPWGTQYDLVNGAYGNLRLINLSVADSGQYIAESTHPGRSLRVKYSVRVRAPLGVKVTPSHRIVDWGSRVELTCQITGHPRQLIYWLHNARLVPRRHHVRHTVRTSTIADPSPSHPLDDVLFERLIIEAFTLDDIGVYQCIVENGHSADRLGGNGAIHNSESTVRPDLSTDSNEMQLLSSGDSTTSVTAVAGASAASSTATGVGDGVGDLVDNAQSTALLVMGQMRPSLMWQNPAIESGSIAAHVLLSIHSGETAVTLECHFAANPVPQVIWYRDDQPVPLDESGVISPEVVADKSTAYTTITRLKIDIRKVPDLEKLWTFGGEYRAVANNTFGLADCRSYVLLETALRLRPMKLRKPAIAGRAYTLKCYFIGSGIPTLQWHRIKSGRDVQRIPVDHRHQLLEDGRVLRISEVNQEQDEADYRCTATHGDRTTNATVTLKVSHAPHLFELPQMRQVRDPTDTLAYSCTLQNRADKPWYAWWEFQREGTNAIVPLPPSVKSTYNGFSILYAPDAEKVPPWRLPDRLRDRLPSFVHTKPNKAVHVSVNNLRKEQHHGNLTCVVLNKVGEDRQSVRVTFVPELEFSIRPPNNRDVTLGETIAIDCAANPSDLDPIVEWKYFKKTAGEHVKVSELTEATNGRIRQQPNGTLILSSVDESDPREFLCFLKPGGISTASKRSSAVNLEVHVPARIDPIDHVEKVRGSRFNLTCSVHGDAEDLTADWYYRRSPLLKWELIDKPCVVPSELLADSGGRLRDDGTLDPIRFKTNGDGEGTGSYKTDSFAPSLVDCQSYATEGLNSGLLFRQASFFKPNKRGMDKQLQFFSVKEAHMGEYLCRASNQYNRDAFGVRTEVDQFVRLTVISVPGPVNIINNSTQTTATTVSFAWLPPPTNGNKPIRKYRIRYSRSDGNKLAPTEGTQPNVTELEVNENTRRIELKGLRPYTMYRINLCAINDVGPSEESGMLLTTQEAKPSGPVLNLMANGTASDTVVVTWDNPAPEHLNGNVDRYWVCRQRVNDSFSVAELALLTWPDESTIEHATSAGGSGATTMRGRFGRIHCVRVVRQRDYELTGLPKFTAYAFRVIAMNSKGLSPPAFTQARTLEDLPQAPPTDVSCASQQHSITVSWNPPNPESINGILTEYHVSYFAANIFGDETSSVNQAVKGQTTVTLAGLLAYTNYTIQVAVSNRKGRGPASPRLVCLTKEAPPGSPDNVKASPLNASCLVISWSHPQKPQGATRTYCIEALPLLMRPTHLGVIKSPILSFADRVKGPCVKPDFSQPYNYHTYCGLDQRPYNISVRAVNQFEGHKTWTGPVQPVANPSLGIISIGGRVVVQNKMPVRMDCLVIGGYQPQWEFPNKELDGILISENGTLRIASARLAHSGTYKCSAVSDNIAYELLVQEPPRKPIWHKFTPSLRGIQAEWLSPGSKRLDAPISWFYLNWTNLFTGLSGVVRLLADQRAYYLSNLTCATTVRFQLRAANKMGNSSLTEVTSWTTLGSAPKAANAVELIPNHLRYRTAVAFNLSSFLPGNGCPPLYYRLLIAPSEDGHLNFRQPFINRTLTRADLVILDGYSRDRCCYNVTDLNSGSHYHYKVVATNAAGSASIHGQFWTLTILGREPVLRQTHLIGQTGLWQRTPILVPLSILAAIILISLVALPCFCRYRRMEESLRPTNKTGTVTMATTTMQCQNDLRGGDKPGDGGKLGRQQRDRLLNPASYQTGRSVNRAGGLAGQVDSEASTVQVATRQSGIAGWFGGARSRLYDRGRATANKRADQTDQGAAIEPDRLSIGSMDSEGNISPYAIYAASNFPELAGTTSQSLAAPRNPTLSNPVGGGGVALGAPGSRTLGVSGRAVGADGRTTAAAWNATNARNVPTDALGHNGHHYHYPLMDNNTTVGSSTVGRPRLYRTGSMSRLRQTAHGGFLDPRLLPPSTAALLDPMMLTPYDNNDGSSTLTGGAELGDWMEVEQMHPMRHAGLQRRVNSFESLHRLPRGVSQTYHRGFSHGGHPTTTLMRPDGTIVHVPTQAAVSFYDPTKQTDPAVAYRGSVLSSTTASSNQDELMQVYEYGRRQQPRGPPNGAFAVGPRLQMIADRTPNVQPGDRVLMENEVSGESGSSDATDSGIRQFTQQPPQPDEARHAACEVPLMYNGGQVAAYHTGPGPMYGLPRTARTAGGPNITGGPRLGPGFTRPSMDCPSEITDTYASVDYLGTPYEAAGQSGMKSGGPMGMRMASGGGRGVYGGMSSRTRQPLPALPSASSMSYMADDASSAYAPAYVKQQSHPGSYQPNLGNRIAPGALTDGRMLNYAASRYPGDVHTNGSRTVRPGASGVEVNVARSTDSQLFSQPTLGGPPRTRTTAPPLTNPSTAPPPEIEENVYTSEFVLV